MVNPFLSQFLQGVDPESAKELLIHLKYRFPKLEQAGLREWADIEHLPELTQRAVFAALIYLSKGGNLDFCPDCPTCQAEQRKRL